MALRRGGAQDVVRAKPTCNPCTEGDHGRCATALGHGYLEVICSDFDCGCFARDVDMHKNAADERQHDQESHFGRVDWDTEGRSAHMSYGASQRREYQRWAEEM